MTWTPQRLAWLGLLTSWDEGQTLTTRWDHACTSAHTLHPHWKLGRSFSGFTAALVREAPRLIEALKERFRQQLRALAGRFWKCGAWEAFCVDGTRQEAPHTLANETALGCAGRDKTAPQVYLTALLHLGTGLPWDFRTGPGVDSERRHLLEMVDTLPSWALLVADAGFASYELCRRLIRSGRSFLLRVGSNVRLLQRLGYYEKERGDVVYLWPRKRQNGSQRGRPLVLRLIRVRSGQQTIYLLTNILDRQALTKAEAADLYRRRWGEEVFFRSYKQTLERRKLLSRTAATCLVECQWTMLGAWLLGLLSASEILRQGGEPRTWSAAKARDVVRAALRNERPRRQPRRPLRQLLAGAVIDVYVRHGSKGARNYPRKKREKPPGRPATKPATRAEIKRAARLEPPEIELKWTA